MKFRVDAREMTAGLLSVIKALPVRTAMPSLEGIFIDAKEDGVHLKCSDLMLQKECILTGEVEEVGKTIVPGKLFTEIVRKLPDGEATFDISGKQIGIRCGRVSTSVQGLDFEEFPEMRFQGESFTVRMKREDCQELIQKTVFAVAQEDSKPILTGVLLEVGEEVTAVATDAYQFAMRKLPLETAVKECSMVVPGKSLIEIARMMDETEEDAQLTFTRTHVKVDLGHTCLTARLLDGDYIKYKQILPKEHVTRVICDREELIRSIDRASLMAREGNNNIIMQFHDGRLTITANSFIGKIEEEMDVQIIGDNMEIAFNPKYCLNVLKNTDDEKICLEMLSGISPCVVRPISGDAYYYLIVPVRIYSQF